MEPVGAASSDSLSEGEVSANSRHEGGDGSTEKLDSTDRLTPGCKSRVHPMDKDTDKLEGMLFKSD